MAINNPIGYFKRGNQYWHIKSDRTALLINTSLENYHYDGDAHTFFDDGHFDLTTNRTEITKKEFETIRNLHIKRLREF